MLYDYCILLLYHYIYYTAIEAETLRDRVLLYTTLLLHAAAATTRIKLSHPNRPTP